MGGGNSVPLVDGALECAHCSVNETHKMRTTGAAQDMFYGPSNCQDCSRRFYHTGKSAWHRSNPSPRLLALSLRLSSSLCSAPRYARRATRRRCSDCARATDQCSSCGSSLARGFGDGPLAPAPRPSAGVPPENGALECAHCMMTETHKMGGADVAGAAMFYGPSNCEDCSKRFYHTGKTAWHRWVVDRWRSIPRSKSPHRPRPRVRSPCACLSPSLPVAARSGDFVCCPCATCCAGAPTARGPRTNARAAAAR